MAMQQDRSSGLRVQPHTDVQPARSAGEKNVNGFHETHEETVDRGANERAGKPREHAPDIPPVDAESVSRLGLATRAASTPTRRVTHPEFRTKVAVGEVTVTGVLPGTRPPMGSVAIWGDVRLLSCDEALELVDALLLVVTRMDVVAEERCSTTIDTTRDRED